MRTIAVFEVCPDCKVNKKLITPIAQEEARKGNIGSDLVPCTSVCMYYIFDPRKPTITGGRYPGARVFKDVCVKCGREFTTRIDVGHVTPPTRPGEPAIFS